MIDYAALVKIQELVYLYFFCDKNIIDYDIKILTRLMHYLKKGRFYENNVMRKFERLYR